MQSEATHLYQTQEDRVEASHSGPVLSDNWTPADDEERTRRQGSHTTVRGKEWQFEGAHDEMLTAGNADTQARQGQKEG